MPPTINHGPIGYCIYCGATGPDLSREHIVPLSLGGNHVLLKASCGDCAKVTQQFELFCARTMMGPFRIRAGLPTCRPKLRPSKLSLELFDTDGSRREVEISSDEHPATLILPVFAKPRALLGQDEQRRETFTMWFALPDEEVFKIPGRYGASGMKLGSFEILNFCRLLAKIAHAAAFQDGKWPDLFEPLLPDLIIGKTKEFDTLVGGIDRKENEPEDASFPLFFESVDNGDHRYLVAQLRLFANQGSPIYRVVVGRRPLSQCPQNQGTPVQNVFHTLAMKLPLILRKTAPFGRAYSWVKALKCFIKKAR